jgi:hypothetical protein
VKGVDGLSSTVAVGTTVDRIKSLVKVADELKNVDLIGVELEILGLVVPGLDDMLDCGVGVLDVEMLVVEVLVVGAVFVGVFAP